MRYSLRTLLILLAVGPVVIYYVAMRHIESADTVEQFKDRQTRKTLESIRAKMDAWVRVIRPTPPSDELILSQWQRLLTDDSGQPIVDAWGRKLTVGWRWNHTDLHARSNGLNGIDEDGQGDDIVVHFWWPYGFGKRDPRLSEPEPPTAP
jgi:hypothetical protein